MIDVCSLTDVAPERLVAVGDRGSYTYGRLRHDAARVGAVLSAVPSGEEVLVSCRDRYLFAVAVLGAWRAGLAVALPPNLQSETLAALASEPGIGVHLHDGSGNEQTHIERLLAAAPVAAAFEDRPLSHGSSHLATVHTSGSTGAHRAHRKTATQLLGEARSLVEAFAIDADARVLATVPPHHIYGLLFGLLVPLVARAGFVDETPFHAETVAAMAWRHAATVLVSTPAHLRALAVVESGTLPPFRTVFSSGAALDGATAGDLYQRFNIRTTEVLGSTETGGIAWRTNDGCPGRWVPLPGVVVDADPHGRLLLTSPFVAETDPLPRPCEDRIALAGDGTFDHLGRLDDVVKIGGKRLSIGELEARLLALPRIRDVAVLVEPSVEARGPRVRAAVVAAGWTVDDLRDALAQWFDPVVLPRRIVLVDRIPREPTGKLRRSRLLELLGEDATSAREPVVSNPHELSTTRAFRFTPRDERANHCLVMVDVPSDLVFFAGHFPRFPVLPGVAQLDRIVVAQIAEQWPELGFPTRVSRLKFKQTIRPGDCLELHLERDAERPRVGFELRRHGTICASGSLEF